VAEKDDSILGEFAEFLEAKKASEAEQATSEDYEVEVWDKEGRGARIKRSHAKPFLQSLGIDLDPEPPNDGGGEGDGKSAGKTPPKGRTNSPSATSTGATVTRKYFGKK
jgi:hypothetical protein